MAYLKIATMPHYAFTGLTEGKRWELQNILFATKNATLWQHFGLVSHDKRDPVDLCEESA